MKDSPDFSFLFIRPKKQGNFRETSKHSSEVNKMKVNGAGGSFYGYRTSGLAGNKAGVSSPLAGTAKRDQVTLSKQVLAVVQMQNRLRAIDQAREDAKNSPEAQALETLRETTKIMKICNKIAARIRAGDHVPLKDLRYLKKHDMQAYLLAMTSRKPKEDPKEWKSAIPKEEQEKEQSADRGGGQADGASAPSGCPSSSGMSSDGGASGGTGAGASSGGI